MWSPRPDAGCEGRDALRIGRPAPHRRRAHRGSAEPVHLPDERSVVGGGQPVHQRPPPRTRSPSTRCPGSCAMNRAIVSCHGQQRIDISRRCGYNDLSATVFSCCADMLSRRNPLREFTPVEAIARKDAYQRLRQMSPLRCGAMWPSLLFILISLFFAAPAAHAASGPGAPGLLVGPLLRRRGRRAHPPARRDRCLPAQAFPEPRLLHTVKNLPVRTGRCAKSRTDLRDVQDVPHHPRASSSSCSRRSSRDHRHLLRRAQGLPAPGCSSYSCGA